VQAQATPGNKGSSSFNGEPTTSKGFKLAALSEFHQDILEKKMKKFIKAATALGLVSCAAMSSSFAATEKDDAYWYIGGNIGQSRAKIDDENIVPYLPGTVSISDDDKGNAFKLFGGYQFNKNFAVEGGYFNLGQFGYTATTVPAGTLNGNIKLQGFNIDAVGMLPLADKFSVFGRLGLQYAQAKDNFSSSGVVATPTDPNPSKSAANYKYGAGLQYDFNESLGMRLEAERYRVNDAIGNDGDINMYSVGLVYRFNEKKAAPPPPAKVAAAPAPAPMLVIVPVVKTQRYCSILDIRFEIKQQDVQREDKEKLAVLGTYMNKYPDTTAVIQGFADNVGTSEYNLKLSQQRADSVVNYLVNDLHIAPSRLKAVGYGEAYPIADNSTTEGQQANRRIDAVIACVTDIAGLKVKPARVTMAMELGYEPGKSKIDPQYLDGLSQVADFMKANPSVTATVEGHADKYLGTGIDREKTNSGEMMQLAQARAQNVVDYLVNNEGISRSRLSTESYGNMGRVAYDTTLAGQEENRRVNIIINYPNR
jgi:OOP family OmpA-OmpF porin